LMLVLIPEWIHNNNPAWFAWSTGPSATDILTRLDHVIDISPVTSTPIRTGVPTIAGIASRVNGAIGRVKVFELSVAADCCVNDDP